MVVVWSRNSCLGSAEIVSFVFLVLFKDGGPSLSSRFHLFFLMLIKGKRRRCVFKINKPQTNFNSQITVSYQRNLRKQRDVFFSLKLNQYI